MYKFEFLVSWAVEGGIQTSYAYAFGRSKIEARRKILSKIPYEADAEYKAHYTSSLNDDSVKLWYFDRSGKECRETY